MFAKSGKEINKLSEYNDFFKADEFLSTKESLKLSLSDEKAPIETTMNLIEKILSEAESGYRIMHSSKSTADKKFNDFKHSVIKA